MANFPGNVPLVQGAALIDFNNYQLEIVRRPTDARLAIWKNLEDVERRLAHYRWALHVIRERGRNVWLIQDIVRAFLFGFEATIQSLGYELYGKKPKFGAAINNALLASKHYGLNSRGLRTLRHLEAHIGPSGSSDDLVTWEYGEIDYSGFTSGSDNGQTVSWHFMPLTEQRRQLAPMSGLTAVDIADWNARTRSVPAREIMRTGLGELLEICREFEAKAP